MKRNLFLFLPLLLFAAATSRAQDAAVEERLNQLNGLVQDLLEDKANQKKQLENLAGEIESLRAQLNQPNTSYAMQEDLKHLADNIREIDRKREADKELILKKIESMAKTLTLPPRTSKKPAASTEPALSGKSDSPLSQEQGFEYLVQPGDTLSVIAAAYREKKINVTAKQILQANHGLDEKKLKIGQKIFIPVPK